MSVINSNKKVAISFILLVLVVIIFSGIILKCIYNKNHNQPLPFGLSKISKDDKKLDTVNVNNYTYISIPIHLRDMDSLNKMYNSKIENLDTQIYINKIKNLKLQRIDTLVKILKYERRLPNNRNKVDSIINEIGK